MQVTKRIPAILFPSACMLVYGYTAIDTTAGRAFSVSVDLGRPESVVWPFEIAIVGEMGQEGLRIAPNVGAGWKGQAGGEAAYRFYVTHDGRYHVWANALWFDKCTNAVFAKVDQHERAIIGNDPVYRKWHWVRGFSIPLNKGAHLLQLSNHSDNVSLQNVLFINSATVTPDDCSIVFSDVFYDGFDGCHVGNFASWEVIRGDWTVKKPAVQYRYVENALIGRSKDSAAILYRADDWSDYSFRVAVKRAPTQDARATAGLLFGVQDPNHFHQLKWKPTEGSDDVEMQLVRQEDGTTEPLTTFHAAYQPDVWHQVEVTLDARVITVRLNNAELVAWRVNHDIKGGVGLLLEGQITAYFDDAHVRTVTNGTDRRLSSR